MFTFTTIEVEEFKEEVSVCWAEAERAGLVDAAVTVARGERVWAEFVVSTCDLLFCELAKKAERGGACAVVFRFVPRLSVPTLAKGDEEQEVVVKNNDNEVDINGVAAECDEGEQRSDKGSEDVPEEEVEEGEVSATGGKIEEKEVWDAEFAARVGIMQEEQADEEREEEEDEGTDEEEGEQETWALPRKSSRIEEAEEGEIVARVKEEDGETDEIEEKQDEWVALDEGEYDIFWEEQPTCEKGAECKEFGDTICEVEELCVEEVDEIGKENDDNDELEKKEDTELRGDEDKTKPRGDKEEVEWRGDEEKFEQRGDEEVEQHEDEEEGKSRGDEEKKIEESGGEEDIATGGGHDGVSVEEGNDTSEVEQEDEDEEEDIDDRGNDAGEDNTKCEDV